MINARLMEYCERVSPGNKPFFVNQDIPVHSVERRCVYNAQIFAAINGGTVVYGWRIDILNNIPIVQFTGHAIVLLDGTYLCVTPPLYECGEILFLLDNRIAIDLDNPAARMPSQRFATSDNLFAARLVDNLRESRNIKSKYPIQPDGSLNLSEEDRIILEGLRDEANSIKEVFAVAKEPNPLMLFEQT